MNNKLAVVVLAGGIGSRFWPITTNKILFPFAGQTFLQHAVVSVIPKEADKVVVIVNEENREAVKSTKFPKPVVIVQQRAAGGMADALLSAESEIRGMSLLIMIADNMVDPKLLSDVVASARKANAFAVIPGWKAPHYFPGGYLRLDGEKITEILEKPGEGNEPSDLVAITGHFIADADTLLSQIIATKSNNDDVYEKALAELMKHQEFLVHRYEGTSVALKYSWDVLSCMDVVLDSLQSKRGKNVVIKDNVVIEGEVVLGDNVKIFENTKITGPCYIGDNTIIGNNNIIRRSHIGANCVTGFNTDITRSYVGDDCWFHSNYIGDSVLEGNISLGSGAVLANLRLDEGHISTVVKGEKVATNRHKLGSVIGRDVRVGVNASIMPGVKIGAKSFVGSGVILDRDLPEECFCTAKSDYLITKNLKPATGGRDEFKQNI